MQHHPWRAVRDLPGWEVHFTDELPTAVRGVTRWEDQTIWVRTGLSQAERRSTIEHERQHILRGPGGRRDREEQWVRDSTARILIPIDRLLHALRWSLDEYDIAEELWCSVGVVRARLRGLTDEEREWIERGLDTE